MFTVYCFRPDGEPFTVQAVALPRVGEEFTIGDPLRIYTVEEVFHEVQPDGIVHPCLGLERDFTGSQ